MVVSSVLYVSSVFVCIGEQGWCSGERARLPPMWPGFDSWTRRHMWVEFVVGSLFCSEGFSPGTLVFLPPQKPTLLNSNSIWKQWMKSHLVEMPLQIRYYYYCCAASVASEQQHKQDLRKIYRRGNEFSNWSLFTRMHCIYDKMC